MIETKATKRSAMVDQPTEAFSLSKGSMNPILVFCVLFPIIYFIVYTIGTRILGGGWWWKK